MEVSKRTGEKKLKIGLTLSNLGLSIPLLTGGGGAESA